MAGDGRRTDVERNAVGHVVEAGPQRNDPGPAVNGHRDGTPAFGKGRLEGGQEAIVQLEVGYLPLLFQSGHEPFEISSGLMHAGRTDLHVIETDDGINGNRHHACPFSNDLAVNLGLRRNVNHHVANRGGGARQPVVHVERAPAPVFELRLGTWAQTGSIGVNRWVGSDGDLASSADPAPAANRIDVDAEVAGRVEQFDAGRERPAASRWCENDLNIRAAQGSALADCRTAPAPAGPPTLWCIRITMQCDPGVGVCIVSRQHIGSHDRLPDLAFEGIGDG